MNPFTAAFQGLLMLLRPFLAALRFLTIIPISERLAGTGKETAESLLCFPIVGLFIGIASLFLDRLFSLFLSPFPVSVMTVLFMIGISGGLHLDGLADTADGFFSARPRERILEIMRDSHIGTMGVLAIAAVILLKISLLTSIPPAWRWPAILITPLAGRCAILIMMTLIPYARPEGGLATSFHERCSSFHAFWAIALILAVGGFTIAWLGLIMASFSILTALLLSFYCRRRIGGFTGDTLGAVCETVEIIPILLAAAWLYGQG